MAVESGYCPLYRYDPRRADAGEPPLVLDSPAPKIDITKMMETESRFTLTAQPDFLPRQHFLIFAVADQPSR